MKTEEIRSKSVQVNTTYKVVTAVQYSLVGNFCLCDIRNTHYEAISYYQSNRCNNDWLCLKRGPIDIVCGPAPNVVSLK